jgi:hypothetical protein
MYNLLKAINNLEENIKVLDNNLNYNLSEIIY